MYQVFKVMSLQKRLKIMLLNYAYSVIGSLMSKFTNNNSNGNEKFF